MKHAKKSLLIPILALFSVIAIIAGCYMVQAVTAHADGEEVEAAAVETSEVGVPAPGAEDPATLGEAEPNPAPNPEEGGIWARIHLSNNLPFTGWIYDTGQEWYDEDGEEFIAWTGEYYFQLPEDAIKVVTSWPYDYFYTYDPDDVEIFGLDEDDFGTFPMCSVNVDSPFYDVSGVNINMDYTGNYVDVNITVVPIAYYIGFSANGGEFHNWVTGSSSYIEWVGQSEYYPINVPSLFDPEEETDYYFIPKKDGYTFAGWYTEPWGGIKINEGYEVPAMGEMVMLYAHYVKNDEPCSFHFTTDNFSMFKYRLEYHDTLTPGEGVLIDDNGGKPVFSYDIPSNIKPIGGGYSYTAGTFYYDTEYFHTNTYSVHWLSVADSKFYSLYIYAVDGQRITSANLNGTDVPYGEDENIEEFSIFNNIVLSIGWETPGFISVASDNGQLFECEIDVYDSYPAFYDYPMPIETSKFVSDFVPIFIDANDIVFYSYGATNVEFPANNANGVDNHDSTNIGLCIEVYDTETGYYTYYKFRDNFVTVFDWFDLNSYILGVNFDGNPLPVSYKWHPLFQNGYYTFELQMTDHPTDTTVTYNANGGKFADDSDTMTLDARFGEPLPIVEAPKAIDNDFVGWFTEPEGGVQVDPEHFIWMPWQRETGVTLYAHWAYNPQPVPPEPVPPTPPEPVNPDVPGGGGTAQTGDSMPLVPIAALAVIAALGCGLAIRKEYF